MLIGLLGMVGKSTVQSREHVIPVLSTTATKKRKNKVHATYEKTTKKTFIINTGKLK
jgi:hypothetical protein